MTAPPITRRLPGTLLLTAALLAAVAEPAQASVDFSNTGVLAGWDIATQRQGTVTEVGSPVYKGTKALRARQIYETSDGNRYHAEAIERGLFVNGQDRYYGQAVYIPSDWQYHDQDVVIQQWATETPASPWLGMNITGDKLVYDKVRGSGQIRQAFADMPRGRWVRIVTRLKMTGSGILEIWVDGVKKVSQTGDWSTSWNGSPSIRWSTGIYAGAWSTQPPKGQSDLSVYHDSLRIATTYAEADPANWSG
ncbi:polysaccharide lyase [Nonomuraea sp. CA-141351]|uniref:polysaccharide lyase n=1 Tax=Nonomuraea sp. CA-141351 TaxID=3239996 RepID=UPI003D937BC8